jgi:hypothetical protein
VINSTKAFLLAGASALAILACAAEANAETFTMPGMFSFTAAVSGEYALELLGASGGNSTLGLGSAGGLGAEVSGDIFLTAGEDLSLFVGGQGGSAILAGGGGGGSFVFRGADVLAVAGGGGGSGLVLGDGPGLAGTSGGTGGGGIYGGAGGENGNGGGGGTHYGGGGGAGVNAGAAGYGGDGADVVASGFGGKFPNGGAGGLGGGSGGYGGGGGYRYGGGGGGGGSYLASLLTDQVLSAGVNSGDGSISIDLLPAVVPEPSTWAMALTGFAGLGFLAHMRRRKVTAV